MKTLDPTYEAPEQDEIQPFNDGIYTVKGFSFFSGENYRQDGKPILVAQKNGSLVARGNFNLATGWIQKQATFSS